VKLGLAFEQRRQRARFERDLAHGSLLGLASSARISSIAVAARG
jgi:hypothetical protein